MSMFGKRRNYDEEIKRLASAESTNMKWCCMKRDGEYYLCYELNVTAPDGHHPYRILANNNLFIGSPANKFFMKVDKNSRPTYGRKVKVLSLRKTNTPTEGCYTKIFHPATVCSKIDGDPAKYKLKFETGEIEEIPETLIIPTEEHWSNPQSNYVSESVESSSSSSESESETSSSESDSSSSESETSSSESSTSSSESDSSSSYEHKHQRSRHSRNRKKNSPSVIILPIFVPISPYQNPVVQHSPFFGINSQITEHKRRHHRHHKH